MDRAWLVIHFTKVFYLYYSKSMLVAIYKEM